MPKITFTDTDDPTQRDTRQIIGHLHLTKMSGFPLPIRVVAQVQIAFNAWHGRGLREKRQKYGLMGENLEVVIKTM